MSSGNFVSNELKTELIKIHEDFLNDRFKEVRTIIEPWSIDDLRFLTLALCGESGELANMVKKHWRGDAAPDPHSNDKLKEEVADCVAYLVLIASLLNIDVDSILRGKLPEIRRKLYDSPA